ncbi:MAG: carbohydrate ABC transporter permease [Paenibacillus dendritiformis]|uniref:carbohydrate ABC transporter permease n=1 Tax=Paenibacillus dendritiformis TaxID=130049 RepID=UPI001B118869|nr:carbohydrate ABC transporter permease [Paenibacillus dendritiformis]MDU5144043.1 carbohydrate ABC transporter permease [Paenibacillus dendritiformis]GIO72696.1 sugar ABC transporter permease [Paenibacillus dendritiformis]
MGETRGDKMFGFINSLLLVMILLIVLYPLVFVLSASISNPAAVSRGELWLFPKEITFVGYQKVFQNREILTGYGNTILYTVIGTSVNLLMTILAAFPLSRTNLPGRNIIMFALVFTMFFSGGLIPSYLVVKKLGLLNSMWALVLPGAVSVYNIIIMRTFFRTSVPYEVQEAAMIDGCTTLQILYRIMLPLSMPIIAVMVLFYSVDHWNSYFSALIYLTDRDKFPLQLILREILIQNQMDKMAGGASALSEQIMYGQAIKYAVVIVANLPVFLLYPFLQRYFVKGMTIGAIKG